MNIEESKKPLTKKQIKLLTETKIDITKYCKECCYKPVRSIWKEKE